ncbi:MAG TPA: ECF-type sigma factor [Phycisphaerales bacterium]|nr:ECF-type sigma factor [Phycisphaerales bacterium]
MSSPTEHPLNEAELAGVLGRITAGDTASMDVLFRAVYGELRAMAQHRLRYESPEITLQATALVHEAYLKLMPRRDGSWEGRGHLLAAAGEAMRRILVDHARGKVRDKRGGGASGEGTPRVRVELSNIGPLRDDAELVELDAALSRLAELDSTSARIVTMRFFAGMTEAEVATCLHISERTVRRHWTYARAWLARELRGDIAGNGAAE